MIAVILIVMGVLMVSGAVLAVYLKNLTASVIASGLRQSYCLSGISYPRRSRCGHDRSRHRLRPDYGGFSLCSEPHACREGGEP